MKQARKLIEYILPDEKLTIVDIGGRDGDPNLTRSYTPIWSDKAENYYVVDIRGGYNVTHLMKSEYEIPFDDCSVDLLVSGQTLEHVRNPFRMIAEMKRILKIGSIMIIIAPSAGPRHDKLDCWRFMDDGFRAIADEVGLHVLADWVDTTPYIPGSPNADWRDHVFIGQKLK